MVKKLLITVVAFLSMISSACSPQGPSEQFLRAQAVKLVSEHGSCSGEQVKAPSGKTYILTAGHCRVLEKDGKITAIDSEGHSLERSIIAEDQNSDLLLLEGLPSRSGLTVGKSVRMGEEVRTFTHGGGMDTYKTQGELIQVSEVKILRDFIISDEDAAKCTTAPKYKIEEIPFFMGIKVKACIMDLMEYASTAAIIPGSSGGEVVNANGQLIGVASAGGDGFNYFVTLKDIQKFLAGY